MKKVFSFKKYVEWMLSKAGYTPEKIESKKKSWASKCDGKTKNEMLQIGCFTCDAWMIEVDVLYKKRNY